jgi:hypothetical protein
MNPPRRKRIEELFRGRLGSAVPSSWVGSVPRNSKNFLKIFRFPGVGGRGTSGAPPLHPAARPIIHKVPKIPETLLIQVSPSRSTPSSRGGSSPRNSKNFLKIFELSGAAPAGLRPCTPPPGRIPPAARQVTQPLHSQELQKLFKNFLRCIMRST